MTEPASTAPRVLVAGETLVDCVPADDTVAGTDAFVPRAGGAPANVAAGLCALDEPAWLWTRIGDDGFGDRCRRALDDRGVPLDHVELDADRRTSVAFAGTAPRNDEPGKTAVAGQDADHEFAFYRDADRYLGTGDGSQMPDADVLGAVEVVVVGGIALANDPAQAAVLDLVDAAAAADCTVVFDPNARPAAWAAGEFERVTRTLLDVADVVKATPGDLALAGRTGDDPVAEAEDALALAERICDRGPEATFLTLGADGAVAATTDRSPFGRRTATHTGYPVDVVDPTGAGDTFLAAVVAELARGTDDVDVILDVATAAGALATTKPGGIPALPTREEIDERIASDE